jgi:hypothetical protein
MTRTVWQLVRGIERWLADRPEKLGNAVKK